MIISGFQRSRSRASFCSKPSRWHAGLTALLSLLLLALLAPSEGIGYDVPRNRDKLNIDPLAIPATPKREVVGQPAGVVAIAPKAERLIIPMREIAENNASGIPFELEINSTWLRVECKFSIEIFLDGERVTSGVPDYLPRFGAPDGFDTPANGGLNATVLRPGISFVYDKPVKTIRLNVEAPFLAYDARQHLGDVTLLVGRGGVRDVDLGPPGSVAQTLAHVPGGSVFSAFTDPFFPTILGPSDNQAATDFSRTVPTRWELGGFSVFLNWAGLAGNITTLFFGHYDDLGGGMNLMPMRIYHPLTERFSIEMTDPPVFEGMAIRKTLPSVASTAGLGVFVQTSTAFTSIGLDLNWRWWM